jgi:hypothetical protein
VLRLQLRVHGTTSTSAASLAARNTAEGAVSRSVATDAERWRRQAELRAAVRGAERAERRPRACAERHAQWFALEP